MKKVNELNKELVAYFTNRGWENLLLFFINLNDEISLSTSYFNTSIQKNGKHCDWYTTTNKDKLDKYLVWFFEHVEPFWIKYNIGECMLRIDLANKKNRYHAHISSKGVILGYKFPPEFG